MSLKEYIYALVYDDFRSATDLQEGPHESPFYVGRTGDMDARLRQHHHDAKKGAEDKYVFIRSLNERRIPWGISMLKEVGLDDPEPWEFLHVIKSNTTGKAGGLKL
jgi:hypothetical protein